MLFEQKNRWGLIHKQLLRNIHLTDAQVRDLRSRDNPYVKRIVPRMNRAIGFVEWPSLNAGMFLLMTDMMAGGCKAPLAAQIAVRVMEAHLAAPEVEQWAIVKTENGNVSTLAFDTINLSTGFISGSRLAFALVVDLTLYSDRVARLFAEVEAERQRVLSDA